MKIVKINNSEELHKLYSPDKLTDSIDFIGDTEVSIFSCNKVLVIERDGLLIPTTEWFITHSNNELIYDIENNNWVNLDMFDDNESYCKEIYYISNNIGDEGWNN